jgi:hypothetical protein
VLDEWGSYYYSPGLFGVVSRGRFNRGRPGSGHLFPPSVRTSPFAPLDPANFGAFGARRVPGHRRAAGVGFVFNGGGRATVGAGRRGPHGQPARRR